MPPWASADRVAFLFAIVLIAMGVIQNLSAHTEITTLAGGTQSALGGPVASQEVINLLLIFLMLVIPFSLPRTFGILVGDRRQGWAIVAAMGGKETRFGQAARALFAASTTSTSTGAMNSMHDSRTAPGGGIALFNTDHTLGVLGEPRVNVLHLNLALERMGG